MVIFQIYTWEDRAYKVPSLLKCFGVFLKLILSTLSLKFLGTLHTHDTDENTNLEIFHFTFVEMSELSNNAVVMDGT